MDQLLAMDAEQQRELLLSILSSISDGVLVADADGSFLIMNPAAHRITGVVKESHAQIQIDHLPSIMADSAQISQLFQNLITNAIDKAHLFTPIGDGAASSMVHDEGKGTRKIAWTIFVKMKPCS
jgi:PAS domain-containing protein